MSKIRIQQLSAEIIAEQEKQIQHLQSMILITVIICGLLILGLCLLILNLMDSKSMHQKRLTPPPRKSHNWGIRIYEN